MKIPTTRRPIGAAALVTLILGPGCGDGGRPRDASPIVAPDSESGKKAIAETEDLLRLRKQQEASSRRHPRAVPVEG